MDFFTITNENIKRYSEQLRSFKMAMYADLTADYKKEMDAETAQVLAAQVINYLTGEDIEQIYQTAPEPLKTRIKKIKDQVQRRAEEKLISDPMTREVVVNTLRMEEVYKMGEMGDAYGESGEKARIESILLKFGSEFSGEVSPSMYSLLVTRFLQEKSHRLKN